MNDDGLTHGKNGYDSESCVLPKLLPTAIESLV